MRRLLSGYAVSFNRRHKRRGQLFQNRYKSIVCQEDAYLRELVRYIHLNPVLAGIVENLNGLNRYPYCGHSSVIGRKKRPWQGQDHVMSDERILADSEFVDAVLSQATERYERRYELKNHGYDLNRIAERVAEIHGMEPREILSRGKLAEKGEGKKSMLFLGCQRVGHVPQRAGQAVGNESPCSGVLCGKGREDCA